MALELSLGPGKKPVYPTKTTINLMECDRGGKNTPRNLVVFAIALVAIAAFAKFGVVDVMAASSEGNARVASAQAQLSALEQSNANYAELQERYALYAANSLSDEEKALVDRGVVLDLLQNFVANVADLQAVSISGNTMLLQFANVSLEDASRVVASLESSDQVANVSMSTAKTGRNDEVISTITVTLGAPLEGASGEGEGA